MVLNDNKSFAPLGEQQKWCLLEWACGPRSRLAEWFVRNCQHAVRLGLPDIDLSRISCIETVMRIAENQIKAGYTIFLWASLLCTPWTTWQLLNEKRSEDARLRIAKDRLYSIGMIKVLSSLVARLQTMMDVELAFEWPRSATGWKEQAMKKLIQAMPIECHFNGCMYDVCDEEKKK
eukprot:3656196-Heterocapsa_arctica.AAC.1